ncbi:ceramidase domain-containing protein [Telluribacter humicola]|uniref:ceramidase domain-containing protein n=1 Tax=Telluribacter humicola TaxID=1720261 RepID=UPI001E567AF0|nr:ceramidase domain-containing protein [Telluribacter humicola]
MKKALILASAYTGAMLLVSFLLNTFLNGSVWNGMVVSQSALNVEYCEYNNEHRFFHQNINTYSNLAYFFFGVFICEIARRDFRNQSNTHLNWLQRFPMLSFLMGASFIYLSIGSAFFHASLTWMGQRVDMNGTYSISISLLFIALYHVFHSDNWSDTVKKATLVAALLIIISFYEIHLLVPSSILLPVLILLIWILTAINYFQFPKERSVVLGLLGLFLIVVALKIRGLDVQKVGCDPHSVFQGHSLWHVLTAASSFCSYAFFRFSAKNTVANPAYPSRSVGT